MPGNFVRRQFHARRIPPLAHWIFANKKSEGGKLNECDTPMNVIGDPISNRIDRRRASEPVPSPGKTEIEPAQANQKHDVDLPIRRAGSREARTRFLVTSNQSGGAV